MIALFKREFRSYFQNIVGFVFVSLYLIFLGVLVTRYNFIYASASLSYALYDMIPIFALLAPLLTFGLFSAERKSGAYRLLYSLPIKNSHIVLGKYLAAVAVFAIPFAVSAALPLVFNFFGEVNFLNCYVALISFFLLGCALIALCTFISSIFDKAVISLAVSYGVTIVLYAANIFRGFLNDGILRELLSLLTFFGDFENLIYGAFDFVSAVYYLSLCVVFVVLSVIFFEKKRSGCVRKNNKKIPIKALISAFVILIVALNISVAFVPKKYTEADLTESDIYSVSEETEKLLSSIDTDVTFYLLNADGSNGKFEMFLKKYVECGDTLTLEHVNTSTDKSFLMARGYSADTEIPAYTLFIESEMRSQAVGFYDMVSYTNKTFGELSYSEYYYYHTLFASDETYADYLDQLIYYSEMNFDGEAVISGIVEYVTLDTVKTPYFVTGHGENSASGSNISALLGAPSFDVSSVENVPNDADLIIINEPTEDYSEGERDIILNYLKSGGRMLLITDEANTEMPNLMAIAEYYGMSSSTGLVAESADGEERFKISPIINTDHDIFASGEIPAISITNATAIKVSEELRPAQLVTPILVSADNTYIGDAENLGGFNLGVAVEEECEGGTTRIVWLTGADSFNADGASQNELALPIYAIVWMSQPYVSTLGAIDMAIYEGLPLDVTANGALWFGIIAIAVIPLSVFISGWIYIKKRNKT